MTNHRTRGASLRALVPLRHQDAEAAERVMRDHLPAPVTALRELSMTEERVHG